MKDISDSGEEVDLLIEKGQYKKAVSLARRLHRTSPEDIGLILLLAQAHQAADDPGEAIRVLERAAKAHPAERGILEFLAEIQEEEDQELDAAETYRRLLVLIPEGERSRRSVIANRLGVSLWNAKHRDEALDAWNDALREDPENETARVNLEYYTNAYGEPRTPRGAFDDLYHFMNIQRERYSKEAGQRAFKSVEEAQRVHACMMKAWNEEVLPRAGDLDAMSAAEKSSLFSDVTIDWNAPVDLPDEPGEAEEPAEDLAARFPSVEPELAPFVLFTPPLLSATGMDQEEIDTLLISGEIDEEGEDTLRWAVDIVALVVAASQAKTKAQDKQLMKRAFKIAAEGLGVSEADAAIADLVRLLKLALPGYRT